MVDLVIRSIVDNQSKKMVLATIIHTVGSTPREIGTKMLIMENSQIIGTIGGGTAEKLIFQRALELMTLESEDQAEIQHITAKQEPDNLGLSECGGNLDVLLERIQDRHFWQMNGNEAVMITSLFPPYSKMILDSEGALLRGSSQLQFMLPVSELQNLYSQKKAMLLHNSEDQSWFVEPILQTERLLVLGAGHVAREVVNHAKTLDFEITVIDDRMDFAQSEFFPGANKVICSDFATGIQNYGPSSDTYVVIASRSHQTDADCVREVLKFKSKYVGMLGSTKKVTAIVKILKEKDYTEQNIARLRSPIGLDIGAQTPSEIAVSILAEIISFRRTR